MNEVSRTSKERFSDPENDLFSDAMDAAASAFHSTRYGIVKNAALAAESVDGERTVRRALAAAFKAYVAEIGPTHEPEADIDDLYVMLVRRGYAQHEADAISKMQPIEPAPPVAPMSDDELRALCKQFVVEGYHGDYLENDGFDLAREVEELTLKKLRAAPPPSEELSNEQARYRETGRRGHRLRSD